MTTADDLARAVRRVVLEITERLPVAEMLPEEGALTLVDDGERRMQGMLKNGRWVRPNGTELSIVPTHWLRFKRNG